MCLKKGAKEKNRPFGLLDLNTSSLFSLLVVVVSSSSLPAAQHFLQLFWTRGLFYCFSFFFYNRFL